MNLNERNNNPCNLRVGGKKFIGEIGEEKGFRKFDSMRNGYRAAFKTLITYRKNNFRTIEEIITRWAPPVENNTHEYIRFICRKTGIGPLRKLSVRDYYWVIRGIALMEGMKKNDHDAISQTFEEIYNELLNATLK